jgi:hypothetical protein
VILIVGSSILSAANLIQTFAAERKRRWCWAFLTLIQIPWAVYDVLSKQYPFLVLGIVYAIIGIRGWRSWRISEIQRES